MQNRKYDKNIFTHLVNYPGLKLEFCSDRTKLLAINFIKDRKPAKSGNKIAEPVKIIMSVIEEYLTGTSPDAEIFFVQDNKEPESVTGKGKKLVLDMNGYTDKEIDVYRELIKVKPGTTVSYNELASRSGNHRGARFVGNCMAKNRFPVLIPCHRVIKSDGSTGNFSGGVEVKEFLLEHERKKF
jgi:O-6-methylguanine DNA methyltransferase